MKKIALFLSFFLFPYLSFAGKSDLKLGFEAFLSKNYATTLSLLKNSIPSKKTPLWDYYVWAVGRSLFEEGKLEEAIKLLEDLVKEEPTSLFAPAARGTLALAYQQKGENEKVKKWVKENFDQMNDVAKGEATYALAVAEQSLGEKESAIKSFKEVYVQYPFVDEAKLAQSQLTNLGAANLSSSDLALRADRLAENKNCAQALSAYQEANSLEASSRLKKAECLFNLKRYAEASSELSGLNFSSSDLQKKALYLLAQSEEKAGRDGQARNSYQALQNQFPGSVEAEEGQFRIIKMALDAGDFSEAKSLSKQFAQNYSKGNFRDKALWAVAWKAYRQGDFKEAQNFLDLLQKGASDFPTQAKALYWLARSFEKQGENKKADDSFSQASQTSPYSYYSFMALKKLKNSKEISDTPELPSSWKNTKSSPTIQSALRESGKETNAWNTHWLKAEALYQMGLGKQSTNELVAAIEQNASNPSDLFRILEASKKTDAYSLPVFLAQRYWDKVKVIFVNPVEAESYRNSFQFPFAFKSSVYHASREFSLSPYLIVGLMRQESAFQPWVVSSANAQGLMQLLPATARARAKAAGIAMGDLFDPAKNIELGSAELSALLARFNGNWVSMIAGYNAGPGRPPQWNAQFGNLPLDEFIEEIPFSETNLYVKLVLRNYWSYSSLYR